MFRKLLIFLAFYGSFEKASANRIITKTRLIDMTFTEAIIDNFYAHQESVTLFDGFGNVTQSEDLEQVKLCVMRSLQQSVPVIVYDKLTLGLARKITDMGFELNSPSITKGYLVVSQSSQSISSNLKLFSQINANGRWMFVVIDAELHQIKAMLIEAWTTLKMINILALLVTDSQLKFVVSYNPFKLNSVDRGEFFIHNVSLQTIEIISAFAKNMLNKKISNLEQFALNFTLFETESTATPVFDSNKNIIRYDDVEGEMAQMFGQYLNAKINYVLPPDKLQMGFQRDDGSFTGAIGHVENGGSDMSCNSRFLMYVGTKNCAYLDPVDYITLRYMVPKMKSTPVKLQFVILQMFTFKVQCLFVIVFIVMITFWFIIDAFVSSRDGKANLTFMDMIFYSISILSYVTIPDRKFTKNHDRMILAFLLMFSIIVCNTFQGAVTSFLSNPKKSTDINTLDDLIKSDLKLYAMVVIKDLFKPNADNSNVNDIQKRLYYRQSINHEDMTVMMRDLGLGRARTGLLGREYFGISLKIKFYDNETGEDTIHLVDEAPIMFYATYVVPKSSPFISAYNTVIQLAREAGLIDHSIKSAFYRQELKKMDRYKRGLIKSKKIQVIRMYHVTDLFYVWIICIIVCCLIFTLETFVHKIGRKTPSRSYW